jgi:AraC-like DNA-binding protein
VSVPGPADDLDLVLPDAFAVAIYPAGASFGPRALHNWEFVWMIEGDAEYRRGDAIVPAPEGSVVLCRPGATDFFRWDPARRTRHAYFHFEVRSLPSRWPPPETWSPVRLPQNGDLLRPLFRHLLTWGDGGDPVQTRLTVLHLFAAFVTGQIVSGDAAPPAPLPPPVERAWAYLARRLDEQPAAPVTLGQLADAACVTPVHLCRLFKTATGHTPAETVRLARLDRAAILLARSNYSVREVAAICGFDSPFHFSRRFKEAFGRSPRALRRALVEGQTSAVPTTRLVRIDPQPPPGS